MKNFIISILCVLSILVSFLLVSCGTNENTNTTTQGTTTDTTVVTESTEETTSDIEANETSDEPEITLPRVEI